jgi:hypothetical protein
MAIVPILLGDGIKRQCTIIRRRVRRRWRRREGAGAIKASRNRLARFRASVSQDDITCPQLIPRQENGPEVVSRIGPPLHWLILRAFRSTSGNPTTDVLNCLRSLKYSTSPRTSPSVLSGSLSFNMSSIAMRKFTTGPSVCSAQPRLIAQLEKSVLIRQCSSRRH